MYAKTKIRVPANPLLRLFLPALLALTALAVFPRAALAHSRVEVGPYTIVVGWEKEPVIVGERNAMRDDERRIDLAVFDSVEERAEIALYVRLTRLHRQVLVHERAHRELVGEADVRAGHGDGPALPAAPDGLAEHVPDDLAKRAKEEGFTLARWDAELHGTCKNCA